MSAKDADGGKKKQEQHPHPSHQEPDSRDSDSQDVPSSSTQDQQSISDASGASSSKVKKQKSTDCPVSSATCSSACSSTVTGAGAAAAGSGSTNSSSSSSLARNETTSVSSSCPPSSSSHPCSSPKSDAKAYNAMLASAAASPPRFVAMEEIMKAASGVANMYLAHEIAVNDKFVLPDKSKNGNTGSSSGSSSGGGLKDRIEEMMRKAYWDILQSQLNDSPVVYKQAISLLIEIKEILLSLLLPQHTRLKQEIDEILDPDLIQQQAEHGTIDLPRYGQYILSVMARLCAPVRDDQIRLLTQTTDVVILFRGIMQLLDLMKLDWANFSITAIRPHLQQQSIEYERQKFKEFLESQSKMQLAPGDPLMYTRIWLSRNYQSLDLSDADETETREAGDRMVVNRVLSAAYTELLKWNDRMQDLPPETILMDFNRFLAFRDKVQLYTLTGSVILVTFSTCGPSVQQLSEFKKTLKEHLFLILGDASGRPSEASSKLESAALQVSKEVKQVLESHGLPAMNESKTDLLFSQIKGLSDENNRIRSVLERRILQFVEGVTICSTATPVQIPSGLSVFSEELLTLTGQFMRLVNHNRSVFAEYYSSIISDLRITAKPNPADHPDD